MKKVVSILIVMCVLLSSISISFAAEPTSLSSQYLNTFSGYRKLANDPDCEIVSSTIFHIDNTYSVIHIQAKKSTNNITMRSNELHYIISYNIWLRGNINVCDVEFVGFFDYDGSRAWPLREECDDSTRFIPQEPGCTFARHSLVTGESGALHPKAYAELNYYISDRLGNVRSGKAGTYCTPSGDLSTNNTADGVHYF